MDLQNPPNQGNGAVLEDPAHRQVGKLRKGYSPKPTLKPPQPHLLSLNLSNSDNDMPSLYKMGITL